MSPPTEHPPFTVVVRQIVKPGREAEFEATMREFIDDSHRFEGSGDFHVVRPSTPGSREYTVVHRFTDEAARRAFVDSPGYPGWMERLRRLTEVAPRLEEFEGIAGWFTLPGRPTPGPPSQPKMALVTFLGVYPLTSVLPAFFGGLMPGVHGLLVNVLTTGSIVALLTWVVMPALTHLFATWLFRVEPAQETHR